MDRVIRTKFRVLQESLGAGVSKFSLEVEGVGKFIIDHESPDRPRYARVGKLIELCGGVDNWAEMRLEQRYDGNPRNAFLWSFGKWWFDGECVNEITPDQRYALNKMQILSGVCYSILINNVRLR